MCSSCTLVPMASIDQNCSILGSSGVVTVEAICKRIYDVGWETGWGDGPDNRYPSLDCWAVGPSPLTMWSWTKVQ